MLRAIRAARISGFCCPLTFTTTSILYTVYSIPYNVIYTLKFRAVTTTTNPPLGNSTVPTTTEEDPFRYCSAFVRYPTLRRLVMVGFGAAIIVAVVMNGVLLLAYWRHWHKLMREPHDYLMFNIILCDFFFAVGCHIYEWFDYLLLPCTAFGHVPCFFQNYFDIALGNQNPTNVALLCWDRLRMLYLGAQYKLVDFINLIANNF